jgi:hypothetical protein
VLPLVLLAACGARKVTPPDAGEALRAPGLTGTHLGSCDDPACGNGANPPLGGDHCPMWLPCRVWDTAQPRCEWIHNLEHGHAVLAYNCPTGCADLVKQLTDVWNGRGDPKRILVTPDPKLPRRIAAIVWGFGWQGDDFNAAAIDEVLSHQDEEAPEKGMGCLP